uniref:hypothetical protein n=1 Tax=Agrobacterium tumefaciens TaxID=358 RepID=UPI002D80E38F|nr:hypothetical protein [Agrobacterium tumefaciens]
MPARATIGVADLGDTTLIELVGHGPLLKTGSLLEDCGTRSLLEISMECTLVGAPLQVGAGHLGCEMAPAAFRIAGLATALEELGTGHGMSANWVRSLFRRMPIRILPSIAPRVPPELALRKLEEECQSTLN